MGETHAVYHAAASHAPKRFDGKNLPSSILLWSKFLTKGMGLGAVDVIALGVVTADIRPWRYGVQFTTDLDHAALHDILDRGSNIADAEDDPGSLQ